MGSCLIGKDISIKTADCLQGFIRLVLDTVVIVTTYSFFIVLQAVWDMLEIVLY